LQKIFATIHYTIVRCSAGRVSVVGR